MKTMMMITVAVLLTMTMVKSDEKTYTITEVATSVVAVPGKVKDHLTNEWEETKEFQAKSFAEAKTKWPWNKIFKTEEQTEEQND
tara:strand:+ start:792 stop:1046 length:255 start_codon:yes stop_codon:yes gene_type:complete